LALTDFAFSPATGLRNTTSYPSAPGSGTAAREQVQGRLDEVRDFINGTLQTDITEGKYNIGSSAAGTDTYIVIITNVASYAAGLEIFLLADVANTGAATVNVNSLGAVAIKKNGTTVLEDGDIPAGGIACLKHDGTNFQLLNPVKTSALTTHLADTTTMHGAVSAATANKLLIRDASGRAKVAAPSAEDDIALKSNVTTVQSNLTTHDGLTTGIHGVGASTIESILGSQSKVDTHNSNTTTAHGAVSAATANKIIIRDSNGRAKVAAPSAEDDIARKAEVDLKVTKAGDTMTGALIAQTNTDYTTAQMRNVIESTGDPSGGNNGDIWLKYTA
jgi:RNase P/RNase MRP subunit p29